ncbi:GNAT family N-acetyltransferase [Bhargavaea ullalensis]|uniref:N-acetyltransferase YhbS n=1 Tax=Bhargavaea ullalensis TaxID=1265685 RepID=A0ABV2GDG3_9BACL
MDILVRQEEPKDFHQVEQIVEESFRDVQMSDHREQLLVGRLRASHTYMPELALVAELEEAGDLIGYSLMTEVTVGDKKITALALAPVAVLPDYRNEGVGTMLIREGIRRAASLGYRAVTVLGNPDYYHRFGFRRSSDYHIHSPFEVSGELYLVLELQKYGLEGVSGIVNYPDPFVEEPDS